MKNLFEIFDENFRLITKTLNQGNYEGCSNLSTNLITISFLANYDDGVLIGEVCEGVFHQIEPLLQRFELGKEEQESVKEKLRRSIASIAKSYRNENKNDLYVALRDMRAVATNFQFRTVTTVKSNPRMEGRYSIGVQR